jgi:predicted SAM-dependent methyltransferase
MIELLEYKGGMYPKFQAEGFAAQFAFPFARKVCVGRGCDVGCNRPEWAFVDVNGVPAVMVDPVIDSKYDALHLPDNEQDENKQWDYIFSSHCLEHLADWVEVLDYWQTRIKKGGVLFLYLPDYAQIYWRSWNNRKHIHNLGKEVLKDYLEDRGWNKLAVAGIDLNCSFMIMAEK